MEKVYNKFRIKNDGKKNVVLDMTGHVVEAGSSIVVDRHVITESQQWLYSTHGIEITGVEDGAEEELFKSKKKSEKADMPVRPASGDNKEDSE